MTSPKHMPLGIWSDELVDKVIKLLDEKNPTRLVALRLGMSRAALIGKMYRLGIKISDHNGFRCGAQNMLQLRHIYQLEQQPHRERPHRERPRLKTYTSVSIVEERKMKNKKAPTTPLPRSTLPPVPMPKLVRSVPTPGACSIMELDNTRCRWPMWNEDDEPRLYCGEPVNFPRVYCPVHHRLSLPFYTRPVGGLGDKVKPGEITKIN